MPEVRFARSLPRRRHRFRAAGPYSGAILAAVLLTASGCATSFDRMPPPLHLTGDPVVDYATQMAAAPEKDRVLWEYRLAAAALREGRYAEARRNLDDAIRRIGGLLSGPDASAARSRSLFHPESTKEFVGEPYERAMAYYYRGLIYWRDGEIDNARACFRSAQLADSDAENDTYRGDYVLLDYLDGLASTKLGTDGSDALERARSHSRQELPDYNPAANVLLFAEFGQGPRKVAAGEYGEELRFRTAESRVRSAVLRVAGQEIHFQPWDDLNYQATTRGGRVMDYVLGRKAVFKESTEAVGDVALAGAAIAASRIYKPADDESRPPVANRPVRREGRNIRPVLRRAEERRDEKAKSDDTPTIEKNRDAENTAIVLGVVGILSKIASAAAMPEADTRTWDNLPQYLSFAALPLSAGQYPATLEFLDASGNTISTLTRNLLITVRETDRDTVVFLSEHKQ